MLKTRFSAQFKKDFKKAAKRGMKIERMQIVISKLCAGEPLEDKYRDHVLMNYEGRKDVRECHIQPDWLLVYSIHDDILILELLRTGSHSDIF